MRKFYSFLLLLTGLLAANGVIAQTTINTTVGSTGYTGSNSAGANYAITFVIQNTSGGPINLTDVSDYWVSGSSGAVSLYYSSTSLTGAPTYPLSTPDWTLVNTGTETATTSGLQTISWTTPLSFTIPAGAQYRFAVYTAATCSYSGTGVGSCTPNVFSAGGVNLQVGDYQIGTGYVGYGGPNGPRFFTGSITFAPAGPCTSPPNAGTTTTTATNACTGSTFQLALTGNTGGSGQTYQWQYSTTSTGPWTNIGTPAATPGITQTATATYYYRAVVTCGTQSANSTPVQVIVPPAFPAGTYTIDGTIPASVTNFQTFAAAVSAIGCGTSGPIVFNVAPGTYTEQITIPQVNSTSSVNTITFNGNGATLTYANGTSALPHTLGLNGADWFRFNNLNIVGTNASYSMAVHLWNGADNNMFTNCTLSAPLTATSSTSCPFSLSGSATSTITGGLTGNNNRVTNCTMTGGYYGATIYAASGSYAFGNRISDCSIKDFYYMGIYTYYNDSSIFFNNNIDRLTRASTTTFYGMYLNYNTRTLVAKNRIHDPFGTNEASTSTAYCLELYNNSGAAANMENRVLNNTIYNIKSNGLIYGLYVYYGYNKIYHNTVSLEHTASTSTSSSYNFYAYDYTSSGIGFDIRNNIFHNTRGGTATKYLLYYYYLTNGAISDFNDLYMGAAAGTNYTGYLYSTSGLSYSNLSAWQGAGSGTFDPGSVSLDPMFTSPATGNLKPTNTVLDNKGTPVGITTDILGVQRLNPPDMGAYEFGPGCVPVSSVSSSAITTNSAKLKWAPATGSLGYEYVLDRSSSDPTGTATLTTDTTYNASGLRPYTLYYFHVRVKCGNGGFSTWSVNSFTTICVTPTAAISPTSSILVCQNQPIILRTGGADNLTYQWRLNGSSIAGAADSVYITSVPGVYSVTVNMGTCNKISDTVKLVADTVLRATLTYTGSNRICQGSNVVLKANTGSGYSYQWLRNGVPVPNANTSAYSVEYTGVYRVRITAPTAQCAALSDSVSVTVGDLPNPQITRDGNLLSTVTPYTNYQWYFGGQPISGATSATYSFTHDGSYLVKVSDANGCAGTSSYYHVNFLGINNVQASDISIYPNPATNAVSVSSPVVVNVEIHSLDGKVVMHESNATTVDIHTLTSGVYMMYITDKDNKTLKVEKLVKMNR